MTKTFQSLDCYRLGMAEYKIKDLELLTGIKAHTIRMWEKRYGILNPERTETQIRTYNDNELLALLNVALLNKNGIKISKIAELTPESIAAKVMEFREVKNLDASHENLVIALLELDEILFRSTLSQLIETHGMEETFLLHLLPFLERIGVMWMVGSINPAQEHFISNLIRQKLIHEIDKLPVPENKEKQILLFLPEHEWHEISLLFYHFVLRKAGRSTFYFGQSLPYDALLKCVEKMKPACLVTSWLTAIDEGFVKKYFRKLSEDTGGIPVFAGGYQIKVYKESISKWVQHIETVSHIKNMAGL